MGAIGGFGGCFDLSNYPLKEPVLVSGTDGVGTKLLVAIQQNQHQTIGIDCVAMCVNDIVAQGAEPIYFWIMSQWARMIPKNRTNYRRGCRGLRSVGSGSDRR